MENNKKRINSKAKGAQGERELANKLKEYGYSTRRGQQYSGIEGEDVVGLPGIHIECKRVEKLNLNDAVKQSIKDNGCADELPFYDRTLPAVIHRKNRQGWLVTMTLEHWIELYREWLNGRQ